MPFYFKLFTSVAFISSCATVPPWRTIKIDQKPDFTCGTGAEAGYDLYVWKCLNGERIAIYQWASLFHADLPVKETAKCGELTNFEKEKNIDESKAKACGRSVREWNTEVKN